MLLVGALALVLSADVWAAKAKRPAAKPVAAKTVRAKASVPARRVVAKVVPRRPSQGELQGLHDTDDPLDLKSSVALVIDQDTNEVLFSKNPQAVLPIASITKLMTALVVTEAGLPLDEMLTVTEDDVDTEKGSRSRLRVGTQLDARRDAAPGADGVGEPRCARAGPHTIPAACRPSSRR